MKLARLLFWLLIGVALSPLALVGTARAEYLPDAGFLAKMEKMLVMAGEKSFGDFHFKEVKAGKPYREGDVAYFSAVAANSDSPNGDFFVQLEEWRTRPDGNFEVTYTKMWPDRAIRWTMRTNEKSLPTFSWEEELDITSVEAIAASERAQELLRDHGRPTMIGGPAI